MDENIPVEDTREDEDGASLLIRIMERSDTAKRFKTDESADKCAEPLNKDNTSTSSAILTTDVDTTNPVEDSATTSTNETSFRKARNIKSRNYRHNIFEDDSSRSTVNENEDRPASSRSRNQSGSNSEGMVSETDDLDSSSATVLLDTDVDSDYEEHPVLKKQQPKHNWFVIPEIINRQIGHSSKKQSSDLFQRRCYGSLHCVQRLELMYKLDKHDGCVNSLNFHPDGSLLASGSDDLKVIVWDWKYGTPLVNFDSKHRGNVFQSKFLPLSGDLHIATCARDGQVRLTQVSVQEGVRSNRKMGAHRGACHKLAVLHNQPFLLLSAGEDGVVLSHDIRTNKPEKIITVMSSVREIPLYSINSHPLNSYEFCISGRDHIVRTYDQRKCGASSTPLNSYFPKKLQKPEDYMGLNVTCAVYNYNGSEILASYNDGDIYIFDVNGTSGTFVHEYQGHRNGATIKGVNFFGPKSEFVISGSDCGNIYIWEKNTEAIVNWMLADDSGVVNCLETHPQLPFLCTSGLDWDIKVWVPSCEKDPLMTGLSETVKTNSKARTNYSSSGDLSDSQMLWILWRHLHSTNRIHRNAAENTDYFAGFGSTRFSSDSSSSSNTEPVDSDDADSDELENPPGCTTS